MNKKQIAAVVAVVLVGLVSADYAAGSGITVSAYTLIQNAGSNLVKRTTLNFLGTGVSCADDAGNTRTNCTINGTGTANFAQAFSSVTSVVVTHNLNTLAVEVQVYDAGSPPNLIIPQNVALTSANVVTVTFSGTQSGTVVVNGAAAGVASSVPFSGITSGTNNTAQTMTVGSTSILTFSGSGVVNASSASGTTIASSAAADQALRTTASGVGSWTAVPDCDDSAGNHLNYDTTAHTFSCGTSSGGSGANTTLSNLGTTAINAPLIFASATRIDGSTDGVLLLTNQANSGFTDIAFGAAGPQVRVVSGNFQLRNSANSASVSLTSVNNIVAAGTIEAGNGADFHFPSSTIITAPSDGVLRLTNTATTSFTRLQFGGGTASFPALQRSGSTVQVVAADDSVFTEIQPRSVVGGGSAPTVGTCGTIGTGSKNVAGFITSNVTGSCVAVLTFNGFTAPTGWSCGISNATTANLISQTGSSTTTATFTGTTVTGDVLRYACSAY